MKQLRAFSIIALVLGSAGIASGQTSYTWALPQDGVWGIPENWSPANVPDATAEAAILNGPGPYTVSLFQHLGGISSLTIEDSAVSLAIESGGHLGVGWMLNNGLIRMKAESGSTPARLYFYVGLTLSGDGELRMEGDVLRPTIGSEVPFTNVAPHRITGAGVIDAGFVNDSLMSANLPGKRLSLLSSINTNNSVMQAENSGILEFDNCYVGQGPDGVIARMAATSSLSDRRSSTTADWSPRTAHSWRIRPI
ncbi:MAG: hypothetical protein IPK83_21780 [Planctomycetes bacterium]|nr:hypothetical protein [Planctomycetota bacterium]